MKLSSLKQHINYGLVGGLLGAVLTKIGYADYDELHRMFIFSDLRMLYSFAGAVGILIILFPLLRKRIPKEHKIFQPGTIPGSMLFGFGWAISGACPGLVFVQLGHGALPAVFTMLGITFGVWLYRKAHARFFGWDTGTCGV
jgi:uncharacterized membrane protein YedE/YeeE